MNAGTTTPAVEAAKTRLVVALEWLFEQDDQWRPVRSAEGATITLTRCRAATVDTVVMNPGTTCAVRQDPQAQEVARVVGTAAQVVAVVCGWPEPSGPGGFDRVPALSGPRP